MVQPNGLLVFRDPARTTGTSVTFDPDGSGSKLQSFPGQDIRSNTIINTVGYRDPGDTLRVTSNVSGDINPGYLRTARQLQAFVDDDFARWNTDWASTYINYAVSLYNVSTRGPNGIGAQSLQQLLADPDLQDALRGQLRLADLDASTLASSAGVIRVSNGATWRTAETTGADFMLVDNGTLALEGGALRTPELRVMPGSIVVGHGDIASVGVDTDALLDGTGPSYREDGFNRLRVFGTLMPRGGDLVTHGYVNIMPGGQVLFDVTEAGAPAVAGCASAASTMAVPKRGAGDRARRTPGLERRPGLLSRCLPPRPGGGADLPGWFPGCRAARRCRLQRQHHCGRRVPPAPRCSASTSTRRPMACG